MKKSKGCQNLKKSLLLTLIMMIVTTMSWGQDPTLTYADNEHPETAGTETNPYLITSSVDWAIFANWINKGTNAYAYYKLTADIQSGAGASNDATTNGIMIGTKKHPFMGTFDGDGNELVFFYKYEEVDADTIAPFKYTNNAIIKNLNISGGFIKNENFGAAGLIGCNLGSDNTIVNNVTVGVSIYSNGDYSGGFVVYGSHITFTNCSYIGSFGSFSSWYAGGFCGYGDKTTQLNGCLYNPSSSSFWGENFVYTVDDGFGSAYNLINCYYTEGDEEGASTQGVYVYTEIPDDNIAEKLNTINGVDVYNHDLVTVVIDIKNTVASNEFNYTGNVIDVEFDVTYNGAAATVNTDYTYTITDHYGGATVQDIGEYTLTVYGKNESNYYGSKKEVFSVTSNLYGKWRWLKNKLEDPDGPSSIRLDSNYVAGTGFGDGTITINRDVEIDLNGFTIDRNLSEATEDGQVIRINSGKTVSITGPGIITGAWNKAKGTTSGSADNDGGGIYNKGNLTLNKVTVSNNKCEKKEQGTSATARGGGIYSGKGSSLTLINVSIRENTAQGGGGGVFADEATIFVVKDNSIIRSNVSADKGGGIRVKKCGTATIINSFINNNTVNNATKESVANGGGVYCEEGSVTIKRCEINNNIASKFGGGIYIQSGTVYAKDCTINKNQSYDENRLFNSRGGGVYLYNVNCTFIMSGGTIYGNSSNLAYGGGVFVNNGAKFKVRGNVDINGNWRFYNATGSYETTNVYITGKTSSDVIAIDSLIGTSKIGIAKNGGGVFTNGLSGNGDENNFTSDDKSYVIQSSGTELAFGTPSSWEPSGDEDPLNPGEYIINSTVIIDNVYSSGIDKITFGDDGKIIIIEGGYLETNIINDDVNKVMIYGGQLKVPEDADVKATMRKDILSATALSSENWYLISSGITNPSLVTNTNLLRMADEFPEYDLYRFNEGVELQWENYRAGHADFTTLQNGRGYLYRNANDYTINIRGTLNTSDISSYTLSYSEEVGGNANVLKGFNIIGNPYTFNIYKNDEGAAILNTNLEDKYYVLNLDPDTNPNGIWTLTEDGTAIPPMTGIMVQAKSTADGAVLNIDYTTAVGSSSSKANNDNLWFTVGNNEYKDRACVEFKKGHGLNKIPHLNENAPMLYINHNGEDFASVDMNPDAKAFNLSFEAKTTGMYTLNMNANGEYDYIHVYDKVAGRDIDLLNDEEYTFIGSPMDRKDRFEVRLNPAAGTNSNGNTTFAYQSGDDILVSGDGELQMFDVMGRLVAQQHINGVEMVAKPSTTGVYILRLNEKTQKMVVR